MGPSGLIRDSKIMRGLNAPSNGLLALAASAGRPSPCAYGYHISLKIR